MYHYHHYLGFKDIRREICGFVGIRQNEVVDIMSLAINTDISMEGKLVGYLLSSYQPHPTVDWLVSRPGLVDGGLGPALLLGTGPITLGIKKQNYFLKFDDQD